ncbi:uncharacterized protein EI90DRAFT_3067306 [Cantharellus anzutake]|uniref:uncharacterized protein n=1 Tax=Cantharellus anzutake TaxID=1750568 RepID=UPI001904DBFD|nr:uncharacterized protein EI90DRAFT_3067306 [Cantharellus anzutake]KAF8327581.1 hypothetical protein EI90DRAFT_3067306 [Cantharellus anzutake]
MSESPKELPPTDADGEDKALGVPEPELVQDGSPERDQSSEKGGDSQAEQTPSKPSEAQDSPWHAIYSPAHGAYYFYNTSTNTTTWVNPLAPAQPDTKEDTKTRTPEASTSAPSSQPPPSQPSSSAKPAAPTSDALGGIDPELAFLDPSLAYAGPSASSTSIVPSFTAKFSARTGKFAGASARDPSHVSEYERAKRMSEAYFDVEAWQKEVAERDAAKKRAAEEAEVVGENPNQKRKPTKADIARWKEAKKEKKSRRTAWLRE